MALLDRLGVRLPVVQAGMGGGVARHELAAAVSDAGGLGTLGFLPAGTLGAELREARRLTGAPLAVNLLLPFARDAHWRVAAEADVVVTFWGRPRRRVPGPWLHQCGSVEEARAAAAAGADGVVVQGVEAGGHVRGTVPALELLARVRAALPALPLLLAGGVAAREDVGVALAGGAEAAVLGTRFLLSEESRAHPAYRERVLGARRTVLTELFGAGWPAAPHRVVPNAATDRWLRGDPRGPAWLRLVDRAAAPAVRRLPPDLQGRLARTQRAGRPPLGPQPPTDDGPPGLVDAGPLYAGETARRITDVRPAGQLARDLAP